MMTLREAIDEVKDTKCGLFYESKTMKDVFYVPNYTAIATILNAVVKGELKHE